MKMYAENKNVLWNEKYIFTLENINNTVKEVFVKENFTLNKTIYICQFTSNS